VLEATEVEKQKPMASSPLKMAGVKGRKEKSNGRGQKREYSASRMD